MTITSNGTSIVITLSIEEASVTQVDHGENELCIPVEDTLNAVLDLGRAIREAAGEEEGR